ncbi:hypothetical protein ACJRO7_023734 [Eucalyptus globulus]|uniref:Uncharacterized protein n=1 Tax=Eucalyptus globulus TaxID=34317 RepID=A0ABD3K684_EUCGL
MSAVSSPLASVRNPRAQLSSSFVHPLFRHRHLTSFLDLNQMIYKLLFATNQTGMLQLRSSRQLTVSAEYRDGGRPSSASIFVDGFVLGGIIVDAPGCVYAPQILFELLNIRFSVFFPKFFSDNFSQAVHQTPIECQDFVGLLGERLHHAPQVFEAVVICCRGISIFCNIHPATS